MLCGMYEINSTFYENFFLDNKTSNISRINRLGLVNPATVGEFEAEIG